MSIDVTYVRRNIFVQFELNHAYISGQKSQFGLDTKTYWLTDRQL
jgi:hypothetical protein